MEQVERYVEVDAPLRAVYDQWTQFEDFPRFMPGVKSVKQTDATHLHWEAEVWGKDESWDSEITEQEPDKRISWKSINGAYSAGTVRFEPLSENRTRVRLVMAYDPKGVLENVGDALGIFGGRVQNAVERFREFIESRQAPTGAWRGAVRDGRPDQR